MGIRLSAKSWLGSERRVVALLDRVRALSCVALPTGDLRACRALARAFLRATNVAFAFDLAFAFVAFAKGGILLRESDGLTEADPDSMQPWGTDHDTLKHSPQAVYCEPAGHRNTRYCLALLVGGESASCRNPNLAVRTHPNIRIGISDQELEVGRAERGIWFPHHTPRYDDGCLARGTFARHTSLSDVSVLSGSRRSISFFTTA